MLLERYHGRPDYVNSLKQGLKPCEFFPGVFWLNHVSHWGQDQTKCAYGRVRHPLIAAKSAAQTMRSRIPRVRKCYALSLRQSRS